MSQPMPPIRETHLAGARTRLQVVRADRRDARDWLRDAPLCPLLAQRQIVHIGIIRAEAPFRVVRVNQSGTYFMAALAGEGRVLVDGQWQACRAGSACLLPRYALNAFHAVRGRVWEFCYVRYREPAQQRPWGTAASPVLAAFDGRPLRDAIAGLFHECRGEAVAAAMHHWVELIHHYVLRFAHPRLEDDRLWRLWEGVAANLAAPWSLATLAGEAHLSGEHLRRLCLQQLGRSPMQHVIFLRMQRAAELLSTTDDKVEGVARAVGYKNPFVFATTFKKWMGWSPSDFRQRRSQG